MKNNIQNHFIMKYNIFTNPMNWFINLTKGKGLCLQHIISHKYVMATDSTQGDKTVI